MKYNLGNKKTFLDKPVSRRKQVCKWIGENLTYFNFSLSRINITLATSGISRAFKEFSLLMDTWLSSTQDKDSPYNNSICVTVVMYNIEAFGKTNTYGEVFNRLVVSKSRVKMPRKMKRTHTTEKEIKEVIKEQSFRYFYSFTKDNKRRKGVIQPVINNNKEYFILRDIKTGRFLKKTERVKKEIRRIKNA